MSGSTAPFWEMMALLAREPGMEWLQLGLAGQAAPFSHRTRGAACWTEVVAQPGGSGERGAAVAGECRPCSVAGAGLWLWAGAERVAGQPLLGFARGLVRGPSFVGEGGRPRGSSPSRAGECAASWLSALCSCDFCKSHQELFALKLLFASLLLLHKLVNTYEFPDCYVTLYLKRALQGACIFPF